ncbi:hypothetical protein PFISCL1PPCAC_7377 [Pristionchus fissidentatus]|uniref:Uncharacterized protein n=1 Tax=Pristionchus fissidentatus TaxID=1538716 RepID=A0AAV5VDT6_9BILA|nr:hypothetical protein PFISCL1PPCAC_7377 [Pristionchus fissidentatus]
METDSHVLRILKPFTSDEFPEMSGNATFIGGETAAAIGVNIVLFLVIFFGSLTIMHYTLSRNQWCNKRGCPFFFALLLVVCLAYVLLDKFLPLWTVNAIAICLIFVVAAVFFAWRDWRDRQRRFVGADLYGTTI